MLAELKKVADKVRTELVVYQRIMRDRRTPLLAKLLLWMAIGYLLLPFDLIPDFIPLIGHLDDLILVPAMLLLALKLVPTQLIDEHRAALLED